MSFANNSDLGKIVFYRLKKPRKSHMRYQYRLLHEAGCGISLIFLFLFTHIYIQGSHWSFKQHVRLPLPSLSLRVTVCHHYYFWWYYCITQWSLIQVFLILFLLQPGIETRGKRGSDKKNSKTVLTNFIESSPGRTADLLDFCRYYLAKALAGKQLSWLDSLKVFLWSMNRQHGRLHTEALREM